jgi:hypothetical protein
VSEINSQKNEKIVAIKTGKNVGGSASYAASVKRWIHRPKAGQTNG